MDKNAYIKNFYPQDFIQIGNDIFVLPKGGSLEISEKEIGSTFTTADGTKRKDIIKKTEQVSIKYDFLLQNDFDNLKTIIKEIELAEYKTPKYIFLKKEIMPVIASEKFFSLFKKIKIEIAELNKYNYKFRKNNIFIYTSITLKIN